MLNITWTLQRELLIFNLTTLCGWSVMKIQQNAFPWESLLKMFCAGVFLPVGRHQFYWQVLRTLWRKAHRKAERRQTGKAHWVMDQARQNADKHRQSTQALHVETSSGLEKRCGFGRRWEETTQRGHNYFASAPAPAATSNFCKNKRISQSNWHCLQSALNPNAWTRLPLWKISMAAITMWKACQSTWPMGKGRQMCWEYKTVDTAVSQPLGIL